MSGIEGLNDRVHSEAQRVLDRRMRRTPCVVTAYRGDLHAVKVNILPSQTGTNWISIETGQIGEVIAPNIGDPGWLDFHEDDRRAAVFVGACHNDQHPVPQAINAGERLVKTSFGSSAYFKNDGSITFTDKAGTVIATDGTGNATVTATTAVTVKAPEINLGDGGTLLPVLLSNNQPSTVVKAQ
jgi:phage baseplate assembly protein gpV